MTVKLLTEQHLEFINLKGGCKGSSVSILVKIPHCWKSHVTAQITQGMTKPIKRAATCEIPTMWYCVKCRSAHQKLLTEIPYPGPLECNHANEVAVLD